ncbi:MAG: hypothetical protein EU539_13260, partial [Promethearchaeota archaeon]
FVHLMFKSQSKNALADDEELIKEIKYCLEAIGRRLRAYLNRKATQRRKEKRASLIEKYIPMFVNSVYNIASHHNGHQDELDKKELESLMREAIGIKPTETPEKVVKEREKTKAIKKDVELKRTEIVEVKELPEDVSKVKSVKDIKNLTVSELKDFAQEQDLEIPSQAKKDDLIKIIEKSVVIEKPPEVETKKQVIEAKGEEIEKPKPSQKVSKTVSKKPVAKPKPKQTKLPIITTERILLALNKDEWQTIKHLIFKMRIKDMMDARFLQIKLKELERKGKVLMDTKKGKKHWKLK